MAQKVNVILVDDIDGSDADETVSFALDGSAYEIDLSADNAQKLRDVLAPYVGHARRASTRGGRRGRAANGPTPGEIRDWARSQGMEVSDRGRVSEEVRAAYASAH